MTRNRIGGSAAETRSRQLGVGTIFVLLKLTNTETVVLYLKSFILSC